MGIRIDIRRSIHDFLVNGIAAGAFGFPALRVRLLRLSGVRIGANTKVHGRCWFGGTNVQIGDRSWINYGVVFDNSAAIAVGDDCLVGPQVLFITSSHTIGPSERRGGDPKAAPIVVGNGCWLGARCTVLPGVNIGDGSVVAAGAVVIEDCLPNTLYGGVPARAIRSL